MHSFHEHYLHLPSVSETVYMQCFITQQIVQLAVGELWFVVHEYSDEKKIGLQHTVDQLWFALYIMCNTQLKVGNNDSGMW